MQEGKKGKRTKKENKTANRGGGTSAPRGGKAHDSLRGVEQDGGSTWRVAGDHLSDPWKDRGHPSPHEGWKRDTCHPNDGGEGGGGGRGEGGNSRQGISPRCTSRERADVLSPLVVRIEPFNLLRREVDVEVEASLEEIGRPPVDAEKGA
jgi:hypothetical protein